MNHRQILRRPGLSAILTGTAALSALLLAASLHAGTVLLSSLDLSKAKVTDNISPGADKTVNGHSLTIGGKTHERGVSFNGYTVVYVQLNGGSDKFSALVGVDDEARTNAPAPGAGARRGGGGRGAGASQARSMSIHILGDENRVLFETNSITASNALPVEVDTKGVKLLAIVVNAGTAAGGGRRGGGGGGGGTTPQYDLADAKFDFSGVRPMCVAVSGETREILTPKQGAKPRINGPVLTGVSPGRPVFYKIPASGAKPIRYSADRLPKGLKVDATTGLISGTIEDRGTYPVVLRARNAAGSTRKDFKFVAESQLSLTPPLGWNSWNAYGRNITEDLARAAADAFVSKGLIDHGWTYINLDDGWERSPREGDALDEGPTRDENGRFIANKKFPDMKALGDYIHSKGLKFGIYSSPGPTTCQGLEASFRHEESDVMQWSSWGVDYLKYDWCSYRAETNGLDGLKKPYQVMRAALDKSPRDIVFSMCQYGRGNVWEWGAENDIRGNSWRTTGDIRDNWPSVEAIGFNPGPQGSHIDLSPYAGPGHWNDPDMLVVGVVGWTFGPQHESNLSASEQYTHITLWTLYPSPMMLGCDLSKADDFTIALLTNDEVLDIHQDPLGKGARAVFKSPDGNLQVWARPLSDGSKAVGLFNLTEMPMRVTAKWPDIGVKGSQTVRDVWRQANIGKFNGEYTGEIPRHGCQLLKIIPAK